MDQESAINVYTYTLYNVFDTISPSIFLLIFTFYTRNSDY